MRKLNTNKHFCWIVLSRLGRNETAQDKLREKAAYLMRQINKYTMKVIIEIGFKFVERTKKLNQSRDVCRGRNMISFPFSPSRISDVISMNFFMTVINTYVRGWHQYFFIKYIWNHFEIILSHIYFESLIISYLFIGNFRYNTGWLKKKFMVWSRGKVFEKFYNIFWWSLSLYIFTSSQEVKAF